MLTITSLGLRIEELVVSRSEIRSHTGLRGIAALLVVGYHQQFVPGFKFGFEPHIFTRSYLMVDLFFILSGFIMCYVYGAQPNARQFWHARFARIYPLHLFCLAYLTLFTLGTTLLLTKTGHDPQPFGPLGDWIRQLLLLNAWHHQANAWNVPSWSISAEAFAYLLFPAITVIRLRHAFACNLALLVSAIAFYIFVAA